MKPDTFHGLALIIIICFVLSPILLPLVMAIPIIWAAAMIGWAIFSMFKFLASTLSSTDDYHK